jgi:hypothetical protein
MTNPNDVASIDAIIIAAYDVISGPAGRKRDLERELDPDRDETRQHQCHRRW